MKQLIILIFVILFMSCSGKDEYMSYWNKAWKQSQSGFYDSALENYNKALNLANDTYIEARMKLNIGAMMQKNKAYDEALKNYFEAAEQLSEHPKYLGDCYRNIGQIYGLHGKIELAEAYIIKSIQTYDSNSDISLGLNSLGVAYFYNENYKMAIKTYMRSLKYGENLGWIFNNIGNAYLSMNENDSARCYLHKALKYGIRQTTLNNLAKLYSGTDQDSSRYYAQLALRRGDEDHYTYTTLAMTAKTDSEKLVYTESKVKVLEEQLINKDHFQEEAVRYKLLYISEQKKREKKETQILIACTVSVVLLAGIMALIIRNIRRWLSVRRAIRDNAFIIE